jgi:hypothetical protein
LAELDHNLLWRVSEDRALAAAMLFAHRHPQDSADYHVKMMDIWRSASEFVLFEVYREGAKTTVAEEHLLLEGSFGNFRYQLLIGETYSKACQRLEAIDKEARTNVKLRNLFGGEVLARKSIENRVWFKSGAMIEAWGWEQELQSFKYHDSRPDGAYLDDVENQERVRDAAAVDASMRKFWLELVPAMDKTRRRIRYGQTRRAEDCMVTRFAASREWVYMGVPICDGDVDAPTTKSNWPARYPMAWIRAERDRYQAAGMLGEFKQSYMLEVVDAASKPFKEEWLSSADLSPWSWMPRFAIYDPARTSNRERTRTQQRSDRFGKVVVSRMGSRILVHESSGTYMKPDEFLADIFACNEKHRPAKIGVEKNSLDDWLLQPIRIEMLRRGVALPIVALNAPQDRSKEDFIMGLQPFAIAKDVVLIGGKAAHPELVAEWCNFPSGTRDVMNALAYSLRMFAGLPVYEDFSGANVEDAPEPNRGEEVYVAFNASPSEAVCVGIVRAQRRFCVARDWSVSGPVSDCIRTLAHEVRATWPRNPVTVYVPAGVYDQWQRIALVPALRVEKLHPYRGEHEAVARGCLSDRIRTVWHNHRLLSVDRNAPLTLNALSAGYALPAERAATARGQEPEQGVSRLIAEAIECTIAMVDRVGETFGIPAGANVSRNPQGIEYVSANPRSRA